MNQLSNFPDNYIPQDTCGDAEWEFACSKFNTDTPTGDQVREAADEIEYQYSKFMEASYDERN